MAQHKALILTEKQGEFVVGTTATAKPDPGDILVKIEATALNPIDWKIQKLGIFITDYPAILGMDSAGTVEEVGEGVTVFKKGDRVLHEGYLTNDTGTFQQYATVPAEIVTKIPKNISFVQAATVPVGFATAAIGYYNAPDKDGAGVTPPWEAGGAGKYNGQGTLILGGASSVGQYAIQLAYLSGFSPIVVTASLHNTDLLKSLGATHVIDRKADVVAEAREILKVPPSIVFDAISLQATQEQAWKVLGPNGQLVLLLPANPSIRDGDDGKKSMAIFGNFHVHRDLGKIFCSELTELLESGKIKPNRIEVLPGGLHGIIEGLKRLEEDNVSGLKLIAKPQETA